MAKCYFIKKIISSSYIVSSLIVVLMGCAYKPYTRQSLGDNRPATIVQSQLGSFVFHSIDDEAIKGFWGFMKARGMVPTKVQLIPGDHKLVVGKTVSAGTGLYVKDIVCKLNFGAEAAHLYVLKGWGEEVSAPDPRLKDLEAKKGNFYYINLIDKTDGGNEKTVASCEDLVWVSHY